MNPSPNGAAVAVLEMPNFASKAKLKGRFEDSHGMKRFQFLISILACGFVLAGCSETKFLDSLGAGKSSTPQETGVQTGNNLAMPPDLQLKAPGTVTETYQPNKVAAAPAETTGNDAAPVAPLPVAQVPKQDIYAQYGVSKNKPDGTAKTREELQAELKQAMLKKKQQTDPNYGTIFNIGSVFKDG